MNTLKLSAFVGLFAITLSLGACAQSRGSYAGVNDELWQPLSLCAPAEEAPLLGCFELQLNITGNSAYLDVLELGFDPAQDSYRVLARRAGDSVWHLLADKITAAQGGSTTVKAKAGHYIEEYEDWRVELTTGLNGLNIVNVPAGQGIPVAQARMDWAELAE